MKYSSYKSTCSYCGVGCGIVVKKDSRGRVHVEGDKDHPANRGMLCSKGMNLHYTVRDTSDRLLHPQMRWSKHHPLEQVTWDTALDRAAAVFRSIIQKHGPDSVGFYISGQCLTEEYYLVNKLTKGFMGTNNIDTNSRLCMSSAVIGYTKTFGEDSVPVSYDDIELADCFMIAGANPAWCHPILFRRLEQHKEQNPNIKIIVVDPRKTQSCAIADLHLQLIPGTDIVLFNAIARRIIENKKWDKDFIDNHTEFFENYRKMIMRTSLREAARICGVDVEKIKLAADYIGNAKGYIPMWAMGLNQSSSGSDKNYALLNISLITGQVGKPGSGPFSLTGQPNAMGGREVGGMATLLAAHRVLANPTHRQEIADFWGVERISEQPGLTATRMFEALAEGKMKAIWIACTNPSVSMPNARLVDEALKKAKFVVVQDISNRSDTLAYADLVLPAAAWAEKEGTMTNSDRRISFLNKVVDAPGEALPDSEIYWRFAQKMGYEGFAYNNISEVYDEYCRMTKGTSIDITGLSHERLKNEGTFQYPVPAPGHPGTQRLFTDKQFYTPSRKAWFNTPATLLPPSETPDKNYPFILTTGRIRDQWHTMTKTGKVNKLLKHIPMPYLEMHPDNAIVQGLRDGDLALVTGRRGDVRVKVKVTDTIREGVVFLPMHWGKIMNNDFGRANNLTNPIIDPTSKQPDFKFAAVNVVKYQKPAEKIIVIGAGAAAYRFIQTYRELNKTDEVQVFSKEKNPFYNRVLLPEYVSEHLPWEKLLKTTYDELARLKVTIHGDNGIESIDTANKQITDSKGIVHRYDKLILATGSRAFLPRELPQQIAGIFTMRRREDADSLKAYLDETGLPLAERKVLVVGGGLLGLEIAAALRAIGVNITISQRAGRLMERQLDGIASKLLAEDVIERGITIYFNNEISTIFKEYDGSLLVTLRSGRTFHCHAVVYAVGTRPNIELAKAAGLHMNRGVVVNAYLQTSDPSVFAAGEIAEFEQNMYGITAAAEQQADCAARYISGDLTSVYQGSTSMNILKFEDLDLCSIGQINVPPNDDSYEEVIFSDMSERYYKKCIIHNDLLVGAILVGDKAEFAEFRSLIENRIELSDKRTELLRSSNKKEPVLGKLVCSCNNVGEGNLVAKIKGGCKDFRELCDTTGAGLGCGSCKPEVKAILNKQTGV